MPEVSPQRYITQAGWDDVPHISPAMKAKWLADVEPHLRDARSKGEPSMGSGVIYPMAWDEITVGPFRIPDFWPRAFALDVGWNRTAAIWGALERATDTLFLYSEYYGAKAIPEVHATAIKARGGWIPGVVDPASRGRSQADGEQLFTTYRNLGLRLSKAQNSVESGLQEVWSRLLTSRLKVFSTLVNFSKEYRLYKRDENGKVVKIDDHLMDATRYLVVSGLPIMRVQEFRRPDLPAGRPADPVAGY